MARLSDRKLGPRQRKGTIGEVGISTVSLDRLSDSGESILLECVGGYNT
jgi:hypothetical protein